MRQKRAKEFKKLFMYKNKKTGEIRVDKLAYKKMKKYWNNMSVIEKRKYNETQPKSGM